MRGVRGIGRWIACGLSLAVIASASHISARGTSKLTGSLSTDWYFLDDGTYSRVQSYNALRASLTIPSGPSQYLLVRTNLRWRKDLDNSPAAVSQLYVYETYLQSSGLIKHTNIFVGRQFRFSNLGSALIDGGTLQIKLGRRFQFEAFGGSQVLSVKPDEIRSFSDLGMAGVRMSGRINDATYWGVDGLLRRYDGSTSYKAVGLDLAHSRRKLQAYAQATYDLANSRFATLRARISVSPNKWYASGEFVWREPYVRSNSLFSVVAFDRYRLARLGLRRVVHGSLAVDGSANVSFTGTITTLYSTLGVATGNWGLGWRHQKGRGASSDGAYGYANLDLTKQWSVFGNTDLSRYRVQELEESLMDSYAATAGICFRPGRDFTIRAEGQFLRNAINTSDWRLFLRVAKGFLIQPSPAGARP
ncbi:hypothetical protein C3F09_00830 [candidate division GN15 bacterium]|uniref:Alginate export domain-containing protein n=1 Tax=candidate division GN15 bacterium TaxID=2072418 RepID=A0A855X7V9_9BACT|nr:MAG: hypothetical protein C3F09_00830 [candidate division GN15 bacterium]